MTPLSARPSAVLATALAVSLVAASAAAQRVKLGVESTEIYAGLPFVLSLKAEGFAENPAPTQPELTVDGCRVTPLGVTPNVSTMVRIVNGRRSESRTVKFDYRYRVLCAETGSYTIPALLVVQGDVSAGASAARFEVRKVATTGDMKLDLELPERPVWVGETFEVLLSWYLRRDVGDQQFVVPLFELPSVRVEAVAPVSGRRGVSFPAGTSDLELAYTRDQEQIDGVDYTRFRFKALVTANKAGSFELEPARVMARLESGQVRDMFGFRRSNHELFKAEDVPRRLSVRPLPQQGRPASFVNAIGTGFSMKVEASRTVVAVGDPIELTIEVRGDGRLEGMSLPPLDVAGGLEPDLFSVPDEVPAGIIAADGSVKTFVVTARLRSAEATEIPPLPLSYFDPVAGEYRTIESPPVALSVRGSTMVGAGDVVGAQPGLSAVRPPPTMIAENQQQRGFLPGSLVGADLSLSAPDETWRTVLDVGAVRPLLVLLYVVPLGVFGWRAWHEKTRDRRGRDSDLRAAVEVLDRALTDAAKRPAREGGPPVVTAVKALARQAGRVADAGALVQRIETEAFSRKAAEEPLAADVLAEARAAMQSWAAGAPS